MCKTCEQYKREGNVNVLIGLWQLAEKGEFTEECIPGISLYLGSIDLTDDCSDAELTLARELGMPEPELYYDESPNVTYMVDKDKLAQVVELQERMSVGMSLIRDRTELRDIYLATYMDSKQAFDKAKDVMFNQTKGQKKPQSWWDKFNTLKAERSDAWGHYSALKDHVQVLWNHWKKLRDECKAIIGDEKAIWAHYFRIADKDELEEWLEEYLNDDGHFDNCDVDEQKDLFMDSTEQMEVYKDTHLQEEAKLYI